MIELKEISEREFGEIKELFRTVFSAPPWNESWDDEAQLEAYLLDLMRVRTPVDLGLYEDGRLIGISIGNIRHWHSGTEYFIEELCLAPDRQGKGIGREFFRLIESFLRTRGIDQIFLMTQSDVPAYRFYKRLGFNELEGQVMFFKEF